MKYYLKWKLECYEGVQQFLEDHPDIIIEIPEIAGDVTKLGDSVTAIKTAEGIQTSNIKGVTDETRDKKKAMAETVIRIAHKARPLARSAQKWELLEKLDYEITYIYRAPKVDALARAKDIRQTIKDNTALFTNITLADFTAMDEVILAYESGHVKPRDARDHRKTYGSDAYKALYEKADTACDNIWDLVYGYYEHTDPALVAELKLKLALEEEGVHHTGIEAVCVDGNPPEGAITELLQDVEMKLVELDRKTKSDINGLATLIKFINGTYHFTFSKPGFVMKEMILKINRGQVLHVEVVMYRV